MAPRGGMSGSAQIRRQGKWSPSILAHLWRWVTCAHGSLWHRPKINLSARSRVNQLAAVFGEGQPRTRAAKGQLTQGLLSLCVPEPNSKYAIRGLKRRLDRECKQRASRREHCAEEP